MYSFSTIVEHLQQASGLKQTHIYYLIVLEGQIQMGFTNLKSRCQLAYVLLECSRRKSVLCFPGFRGLSSLAVINHRWKGTWKATEFESLYWYTRKRHIVNQPTNQNKFKKFFKRLSIAFNATLQVKDRSVTTGFSNREVTGILNKSNISDIWQRESSLYVQR